VPFPKKNHHRIHAIARLANPVQTPSNPMPLEKSFCEARKTYHRLTLQKRPMKSKKRLNPMAVAAATVLAAPFSQAATITWNVSTITNTDADVSNVGTTIIAASGADGGTSANLVDNVTVATVNGVVFTDTFTVDSPTHLDTLGNRANASGQYFEMLRFADRHSSGTATWSFSGLTVGNTYQFQVWYSDDGSAANNIGLVLGGATYLNAGSAVTPTINVAGTALLRAEVGAENGPGQFATGSFVADQTTQTLIGRAYTNLNSTPGTTGNVTINAYQLRAIPEPAAALLGGLGLLALLRRRRS
jgi:hypothetical protein